VIKRAAMFRDAGLQMQGVMFRRKRVNIESAPEWDNLSLGKIEDQAFVRRLVYLGRAMLRIWKHRRRFANVSLIYARNLDLAILGIFLQFISPRRPRLVYEVLDIHRALMGDGTRSWVLRLVERKILKRSACLVVSSKHFIDAYFVRIQDYRGPHHLVENKLTPNWLVKAQGRRTPANGESERRRRPPWVLGWFGTLRCPVSLDLLTRLAAALPDRFMLYLRGVPTDLGWERFNAAIRGHTNIVYEGRYRNPEDLGKIFARVDFNWCFDMVDPEANSKWLLPNRIYEGGYFNCPAIAIRGTATGQKVDGLGLGQTLSPPFFEQLVDFFESMTVERHQSMVESISALPRTEFCDDAQFHALLDRLSLPYTKS
jgi:succinoglycan biosynthesis protein ExoL